MGSIGSRPGSSGTVTVAGPNATWTNSGNLYVGFSGTRHAHHPEGRDGQRRDRRNWIRFRFLGHGDGERSQWHLDQHGTVFVGDNGTGELTIQNGGLVQVGGSVCSFPIQDLDGNA